MRIIVTRRADDVNYTGGAPSMINWPRYGLRVMRGNRIKSAVGRIFITTLRRLKTPRHRAEYKREYGRTVYVYMYIDCAVTIDRWRVIIIRERGLYSS